MDLPLENFLERLKQESEFLPELVPFFKCIFTFYYVFPISEPFRFIKRGSFLKAISNKNSQQKFEFIFNSFKIPINSNVLAYLGRTKWWWVSISEVSQKGVNIYQLSIIYEQFSETKKRKSTGSYFTPKEQVQFISRYSLYQFLSLDKSLGIKETILYEIIFQGKVSEENVVICEKLHRKLLSMAIVDPSCGMGLFLHEIIEVSAFILSKIRNLISVPRFQSVHSSFLQSLTGYDINTDHVVITKLVLLHHWIKVGVSDTTKSRLEIVEFFESLKNIKHKDFLVEETLMDSKYDLCLGNPPYVRHHDIDKEKIIENLTNMPHYQSVFSGKKGLLDSKADLYFYFWIKLMLSLNPNGVVGLVLSRSWYSSQFIAPIKSLLGEKYLNLDLVVELPFEPWKSAEIITNIVIGHRVSTFDKPESTAVIVWKEKISDLLEIGEPISSFVNDQTKLRSKIYADVIIESLEKRQFRISKITNPHQLFSNEMIDRFPVLRFDYVTMAPFLLHQVLQANKEKFCLLTQLGKLSLGSTTGANKFFYLTLEGIKNHNLSQNHLVPMTKSPKDFISLCRISPKKSLSLLYVPSGFDFEEDKNLKYYLDSFQDKALSRPYFQNKTKNNWYRIAKIQPEIIIPNMTYLRLFVAYNKENFHIDKQWIGFWPKEHLWTNFLLGFMNSTLGILLREIQGTRTLGLGSLKLSLNECRNLLVLDPRLVSDELVKQINVCIEQLMHLPIPRFGEKTKYSEIQQELDYLICTEYLKLSPQILEKIHQTLRFEIEWRLGKLLR